jgi:copper transport protein
VHLSAACLWLGGRLQLALVVWPLAPGLRREAFLRYARLAPVLIALLVTAGLYLSILRLPHVTYLWDEDYGRVLLVKRGLVTVALAGGGLHHTFARPLVERGHPIVGKLSRSLLGEASVGMAVLLAAAVLVDSKPPPQPAPRPVQAVTVSP